MVNKRLLKELSTLIKQQQNKPLLENDYLISYDESDLTTIYSIIKCPYDSVYKHKFIKLNFNISDDYPHTPPIVTFVNYDNVRIHPNMYEDGKCCSTILNTWPSENEKWTSSMGIETILLTFHSFLNNNPYTFEPGGRDDLTYTDFVLHQSWETCLFRYLEDESQPEIFTTFIYNYMLYNIDDIFNYLTELLEEYPYGIRYTPCFEIEYYTIDYEHILYKLEQFYNYMHYKEFNNITYNTFITTEYIPEFNCNICFDTYDYIDFIQLTCNHNFHIKCLKFHIKNNGNICSLCRSTISKNNLENNLKNNLENNLENNLGWIINPETKRRVKIGSRTYKRLLEGKII